MSRSLRFAPLVLILCAVAPAARAQQVTGTGLVKADFELKLQKKVDDKWVIPNDLEASLFFNRARCECDTPVAIRVSMTSTGIAKRSQIGMGNVQLWAGPASCVAAGIENRPKEMAGCTKIADLPQLADLFRSFQTVETTVGKLFTAGMAPSGKGCTAVFAQSLWLWVDAGMGSTPPDGNPDQGIAGSDAPTLAITIDGEGPAAPTNVMVTPGNEALTVSWDRNTVMNDQNGVLVFCSRADLPVFDPSYFDDQYQSQKTACPEKTGLPMPADTLPFNRFDPKFLCSNLVTTSSDWRIKTLQNGIAYQVGVAAVDTHGNASPIADVFVSTPVATINFFDAYRAAGGEASGCGYGGRPSGAGALLLLALGLVWRRRR